MSLNPNLSEFSCLDTLTKQRAFLDNRISRHINIAKPGEIATELGNFYFCRHPYFFLPYMSKIASGFFGVNIKTGLVEYFENNSPAKQPVDDRFTVRTHRKNNTI